MSDRTQRKPATLNTPKTPQQLGKQPYLTRNEAAAYTGLSTKTIARWQDKGLPFYDVHGRVLYTPAEIDRYIRGHRGTGLGLKPRL